MKLMTITLLLTTLAIDVPAVASAAAAFRTPGRAAYCGLTEGEGPGALICWTPNDGFEIGMSPNGRPSHDYNRLDRRFYEDEAPVLAFGRTWRFLGDYRCTSRRTGLTCRNRVGHGWRLGRYKGYRVF